MALTAQNVVDQVSTDMRKVLSNSGSDAATLLTYVDRVHKDCLHNSLYAYMNRGITSVVTVPAQAAYVLSPAIRRVLNVINRTNSKVLIPMHQPLVAAEGTPPTVDPLESQKRLNFKLAYASGTPEYFFQNQSNLNLIPLPSIAVTLDVYYDQEVATLSALSTVLVIPEDGIDMLVAGVNHLTAQYLKRDSEAQMWYAMYERLKKGEVAL